MSAARRRAERAFLWLAVAGLHAMLLLALRESVMPRLRDVAAPAHGAPLILRIVEAPPAVAPAPTTRAPAVAAAPERARTAAVEPPTTAAVGQAITVAPAAVEAAPAASDAQVRLDLQLPRRSDAASAPRSMRDQMLNDPRSNTPRASIESRIANVAGGDALVEERMDATRTRVKQRGACVEVHVSREAQINPWNQSVQPTPKIVKPC